MGQQASKATPADVAQMAKAPVAYSPPLGAPNPVSVEQRGLVCLPRGAAEALRACARRPAENRKLDCLPAC